jgi:hypothetical protein
MPPDLKSSTELRNRWEILALCVWLAFFAGIVARLTWQRGKGDVYPIFVSAAHHWGLGEDLYGPSEGRDVYRYSPIVAASFTPLALLPDRLGTVLWRLLNASIFLAALCWWSKTTWTCDGTRSRRAILCLLVVPLAIGNLNNGQSNMLVIGLLVAGVAAFAEERWSLAAGSVAVACLIKVYPISVGMLMALLAPRRFLPRFALVLAAGIVLPFLLQDPQYVWNQYAAWLHHMRTDNRQLLPIDLWYRDLRLLCAVGHIPLTARGYLVIQLATAAAAAALCLAGRRQGWETRPLLSLLLALGCCWMTVFGSATESCTYIILAPSLCGALVTSWDEPRNRRQAWLWASAGIFLVTQMSVWFRSGTIIRNLGLQPLAALFFLAYVLADAWHRLTADLGQVPVAPVESANRRAA